uniref:Uncharacterized protein n=1 Tax=Anguilla anguilla TaxID=7936 RepID=A0A0E9PMW5_ANGAN
MYLEILFPQIEIISTFKPKNFVRVCCHVYN